MLKSRTHVINKIEVQHLIWLAMYAEIYPHDVMRYAPILITHISSSSRWRHRFSSLIGCISMVSSSLLRSSPPQPPMPSPSLPSWLWRRWWYIRWRCWRCYGYDSDQLWAADNCSHHPYRLLLVMMIRTGLGTVLLISLLFVMMLLVKDRDDADGHC